MSGARDRMRMDPVRFGLSLRALRRRRGWTQARLAEAAGISQTAISRIERGRGDRLTVRTLALVLAALGARVSVRVMSHGEDVDRLLDAGHAEIVERVSRILRRRGWEVAPEVTFNVYGERGSIDILATHRQTGALLVVEVKSTVPDVQATLAGIDRKTRLAKSVARERGWPAHSISRWLVVPGDKTSRRRIERHADTFSAALPGRTVEMRRWCAAPDRAVAGILFVSPSTHSAARHRTSRSRHRIGDI